MNKICTTIEQSKKLIELGIDVNTADMYWWTHSKRYYRAAMDDGDFNKESDTPAWSLTALLSLSNSCDLSKERIEEDGSDDRYWFHDDNFHKFSNEYDNPLDAVFEMVCWLKENGKL